MAFIRLKTYVQQTEESKLTGAKPKVSVVEGDEVVVNTDFITMITFADADKAAILPKDVAVVGLHDGSYIPVKGPVSQLWERLKKL